MFYNINYMKLYHYLFGLLKISILFLYSLHVFKIIDYKPHIEILLEDIFNLFIGVMAIYIFFPFRKNVTITFEDKIFASAAGGLLLVSLNYRKIYNDFIYPNAKKILNV